MANVQFGLEVPCDGLDKSRRHLYMEDVNRLLNYVKGHYDSAWVIDHLQFGDGDVLEGWTLLAYLSALHPELLWGHTVLCQSFRNPALVAKMGATLQLMSGGRLTLGIGAGWNEEEYAAYGYDFPPAGTRVEQLDEALRIIKAMWTQERATFEGKHYRVKEAWCEPKPDPLPIIMVGAFRPKMLRLAARHADWWNVSSTGIAEYRAQFREFERACEDVGRDPRTVRLTWSGGCVCASSEQGLKELASGRLQIGEGMAYQVGEDFVGTPAQIIEQMQPFIELGVDYFILDCGGFPRLTTVELLVNEVLPAIKRL
ncbi:MAG TPA: LLM class flavin-dependent oxidoreductase [Chloroflexia bacterium]|jgi:alkanesulfonate monooxygenase SsuD/methylene tetrahydromethanopterin reductase-like flavin-dependent oxidoreductase (luciferase family)